MYVGFVGSADGIDAVATSGLLASAQDRFPLELPTMVAGRLPDPDAPGEVFITARGAERGSIAVGDRLDLRIANPLTGATEHEVVTIVGIGTLPVEAVSDETVGRRHRRAQPGVLRGAPGPGRVRGQQRRPRPGGRRTRRAGVGHR